MAILSRSLAAFGSDRFAATLKEELRVLTPGELPLDKGTTQGGYVDEQGRDFTVIRADDGGDSITAKVGVFFTEIVINCGCGDDPMPINAYCVLEIRIDRPTAAASFAVLDE